MKITHAAFTFFVVATIGGCSNSSSSAAANQAGCVQGWYLNPPAFPACVCSGGSQAPECAFSDCQRWTFIGFQGQSYFTGQVSFSLSGRVLSGSASTLPYQQTNTGYRIDQTGFVGNVTSCSSDSAQINGISHIRPPDEVASALGTAASSGQLTWTGVQMQ